MTKPPEGMKRAGWFLLEKTIGKSREAWIRIGWFETKDDAYEHEHRWLGGARNVKEDIDLGYMKLERCFTWTQKGSK